MSLEEIKECLTYWKLTNTCNENTNLIEFYEEKQSRLLNRDTENKLKLY